MIFILVINTARRYRDLDFKSLSLGLFEAESSPVNIAENLDFLLGDKVEVKEITTLNEAVINRVGELITKGYLDHQSIEIRIFENGSLKQKAGFDEEGFLTKDWILGLYYPSEKESIKKGYII